MPVEIEYRLVTTSRAEGPDTLTHLGCQGWRLGGVTQSQETRLRFGLGTAVGCNVYHFHFWREVHHRPPISPVWIYP